MHELDDIALLREYVDHDSEPAFAALVTRHVNKVYSVALRQTRNPHHAEEITQAVFVILAKKAPHFSRKVVLSGWLYQAARLTALTFMRGNIRRARREQEARVQTLLNQPESDADFWPQIAPLLDTAMAGLNESDRHAVVLRYFDGKTMKEVGAALGASEDAAKMRVSRALEKLRLHFTKRGVAISAGILTAAISANSVQAAPAALAKAATALAVAKGAATSTSTLTLVKGALKLMAWTKAQTVIVAGVVVLLAVGTTTVTINRIVAHREDDSWQMPELNADAFNQAPPEVKLRPTIFPDNARNAMQGPNGRWMGEAFPANMVFAFAYSWPPGRVLFSSGDPQQKYDFIANLPQGSMESLKGELKNKLGLIGRPEERDTDILLLKVQTPDAPGLKPPAGGQRAWDGIGRFHCENQTIDGASRTAFCLTTELEALLGVPVVDQTGLTQKYDIDLTWKEPAEPDPDHTALKQAMLDQLGLELVPTNMPIEMLVVDKAR